VGTLTFLTKTIDKAIDENFKDDNEITKFTRIIKKYYNDNKTNYKQQISDAFKNIIKLIKDSNKANKDLLDNIITTKTYLQIIPALGAPPPVIYRLELDNSVDTNKINQDMGILMNELINNFGNLQRLRYFIINFIIDTFKYYITYLCMSNKYSISMNQFTKVINDFTASATSTTANYNLSVYIYKFLEVLSENKNIDDLDNITNLIKYHKKIYNTFPILDDKVKILTNKYDGTDLKTIQDLFAYTSTNDFYTEFGYINPEYFKIIMETYSKVLTLSQNPLGTDIKYNHNTIVTISNDNLIYIGLNKNLSLIMKIYAKYQKNKSKTPASNAILLDMIKEELLVDSYKTNAINGIKYLTDFNSRIKEIFTDFDGIVNTAVATNNFLLAGGSVKEDKNIIQINDSKNDSKKRSRKLDYFTLPQTNRKSNNKSNIKSNINKKRKITKKQKHIISKKHKKLTHTIQML
jgi:hypothetical protein